MSKAALWTISKDLKGTKEEEFQNSWLLGQIAFDLLMKKYIKDIPLLSNGNKRGFVMAVAYDESICNRMNEAIHKDNVSIDCVIWELFNSRIFKEENKGFVSKCLSEFLEFNAEIYQVKEHIVEIYEALSKSILQISDEAKYFVVNCSDANDIVGYWFERYDEELDEIFERTLVPHNDMIFVTINDGQITDYTRDVNSPNQDCEEV